MYRVALAAAAALLAGCGGAGMGKIKGKVLENGQPVTVTGQASLVFTPIGADGKIGNKAYAAGLNPDGTFELVASGGEVAAGLYNVTLEVAGGKGAEGAPAGLAKHRAAFRDVKREIKPGENDLTIDLTKPGG